MQHIQWFPGHMTKAMRMMEENLKLCDGAIYVLDARCPFACINYNLLKIFNNKPVLYLLNKSDLVKGEDIKQIGEWFVKNGKTFLATVGTSQKDGKAIQSAVNELLKEKIERRKEKGIEKPLRFMVCGIPNTGKSTVINTLSGRKTVQTGDKAGVTKGKQWIKLEKIELLDTPGTMPPSFENQVYAHHLAYIGSVNDDILDIESLTLDFIEELSEKIPGLFEEKYGIDTFETPIEIYEAICRKRGYLMRKNEFDYTRCAKAVLDDFRKGKLGKICLERQEVKIDYDKK